MAYKLKSYVQLSRSSLKRRKAALALFLLPPWWIEGRLGEELVRSWHRGEAGKAGHAQDSNSREEPRSRAHTATTPRHENTA